MPKRKASFALLPSAKHRRTDASLQAKGLLIPLEARRTVKLGVKDPSMLKIICQYEYTEDRKELAFRNMVHDEIDWNDVSHVYKINAWRNQIFSRGGMKTKSITMWHEDEEIYPELYCNFAHSLSY